MKFESPLVVAVSIMVLFGLIFMFTFINEKRLPDDCVGHACEECAGRDDARILMVRYFTCDKGHAFCVYRHNGSTFAWDWRGAQRVDDVTALLMAQRLPPPISGLIVSSAAFEYDSQMTHK